MLTKYKLRDLIEVTRGMSLPGEYYSETGEYIRLTMGNFNYSGGGFKENTSKTDIYYTGPVREEYILNEGDIITPLTEQAIGLLGTTAMIPESGKYIQSQDVALITCKEDKIDHLFCYYLISSDLVKKQLSAAAQQTKIRHTSPDKIMDCTVWIPDLDLQRKIGKTLYDIDQKILLNTSMNAELEAMAKQLYDYWFVQFDFPDENGKPYKSSGGKMVYNSTLKREIPEGWEVKTVADCIEHVNTGLNPRQNFTLGNGTIKYITVKNLRADGTIDFSNCDIINEEARKKVHKRSDIQINDILFASIAPLGRCHIILNEPKDWEINESVFSIRPSINIVSPFYLFIYFTSKWFVQKAEKDSAGSIFAGIRINSLLEIPIIVPPKQLSDLYDLRISKAFKAKDDYAFECNHLITLRDSLLPMLMNGQVTVK